MMAEITSHHGGVSMPGLVDSVILSSRVLGFKVFYPA